MSADADTSELRDLAFDFGNAPIKAAVEARAVIQKGALQIKTQLITEMRGSRHFKGVAPAMSYDTTLDSDGIEALIGPDKDKAGGALANVAYFGTSRGGGTVPDPVKALEAEAPNVEKYLSAILDGLL